MQTIRSILVFTLILAGLACLVTTNLGLRVVLNTSSLFLPIRFTYTNAYGSLLGDSIALQGVQIGPEGNHASINLLQLDWRNRQLKAHSVQGWGRLLPEQNTVNIDINSELTTLTVQMQLHKNEEIFTIAAQGKWYHEPLDVTANLTKKRDMWQVNALQAQIASNTLEILRNSEGIYTLSAALKRTELLLADISGEIHAQGRLDTKHDFKFTLKSNKLQVNDTAINNFKISASGKNKDDLITSDNLTVIIDDYKLQGKAHYNLKTDVADVQFKDSWYTLQAGINLHDYTLSGKGHAHTDDLSLIMQWIPEVTRLKGQANLYITLAGNISDPIIEGNAHITEITATVPSLGIKIKPMELHVKGSRNGKFTINGKGNMRRGSGDFTIDGYIEPFKDDMPNEITLIGNNVEFINNSSAHLIASNQLLFVYDPQSMYLNIKGNIIVQSGNVNFSKNPSSTVKSKDVVFINEPENGKRNPFRINPELYLRIEDGVKFTGLGLDAVISGKLDINQRQDAIYATGRVTIKEGTYQLPGQTLTINRGRLLFPPGTLLVNPVLDIKMLSKYNGGDLEVLVQGTAQKPVIAESGLAKDQDKALSQALLTSSGMLTSVLSLGDLKISEVGIVGNNDINVDFFDNPGDKKYDMKNKNFVIGMPVGKRLHLQYLRSMEKEQNRLRLKYALGKYWSIGVEGSGSGASSGGGVGADLSFAIETD